MNYMHTLKGMRQEHGTKKNIYMYLNRVKKHSSVLKLINNTFEMEQ